MKNLQRKDDLQEMMQENRILIVQMGSARCLPCIALKEKIGHWISGKQEMEGVYIDIEKFPDLAAERGIFTVPGILVYVEGKLFIRESGYFSLDQILSKVERIIGII